MKLLKILNLWPPFERTPVGTMRLAVQDVFVPGAVQQSGYVSGQQQNDSIQSGAPIQDAN